MVPELNGVLETSLYVEDLGRSTAFYRMVFEFEVLMADERFCALNVSDRQVLLLFRRGASTTPSVTAGGAIPPHDGSGHLHLTFAVPADNLEQWEQWLATHGISIESKVTWPRGGTSLYFRDPDSHVIELATPGLWANY
jgi:catechol 2,3-dioxygenase-like lactoylglutathione lyase family enzyme